MTKKIVFMGTPQFSVPILEALINSEYDVVAVVTQPDKVVGRKKIMTQSPIKKIAQQYDIPVLQPEKLSRSIELETLLQMDVDVIVTAAYGQFLPKKLLNHPKYRAINVHASLLPKYRGGAPIQYALMNGDDKTGISIMYMEKTMDSGDVLAQRELPILDSDNVATLFDKLSILGKELLLDMLPDFFENNILPTVQDETLVTFSPAITKEQEKINWCHTAKQVVNHIRAMNTWPGAYTILKGERFKVWESEIVPFKHQEKEGTIVYKDKKMLWVACGNGTSVSLTVVQPAGKTQMTSQQFLSGVGATVNVGDCFGE